ncbi:hypothetical protein ZIOFF_031790 [Zingiber officinale]|uniref:Uncharacterized protein n=1 Tax=Zingiber officinale TaxID=94328 RepID=A0A8J5LA88_ZINOF|nr:hypothetical protein ZIOFF_031790 [Zingiber officinale]
MCQDLEKEVSQLKIALKNLTIVYTENRPLTKQEVKELVAEITKQPKLVEKEALRLIEELNKKLERHVFLQGRRQSHTEQIESPVVGFVKPSEFQSLVSGNSAIIKQNNTQLQLLVQIAEDLKDIKADLKTLIEQTKGEFNPPSYLTI